VLENVSVFENDVKALLGELSVFLSVNEVLNFMTRDWVLFSESEHQIRIRGFELSLNILEPVGHVGESKINVFTVGLR
jgi:hypothetical protein